MKLVLEELRNISIGITLIDMHEKIVKDGERERVVKVPYKLGVGFRLAMAANQDRLNVIISRCEKFRNEEIVRLSTPGTNKVSDENAAEFYKFDKAIQEEIHSIKLTKIKEEDLSLSDNPIPILALTLLMRLLPKQSEPADDL